MTPSDRPVTECINCGYPAARVLCACGREVQRENAANHLLRQSGGPHRLLGFAAPEPPLDVDGVVAEMIAAESAIREAWDRLHKATDTLGGLSRLSGPPSGAEHVHQWTREYAPGYRPANEADDWRETCPCGAMRTGTDGPPSGGADE